MDHYTSPLSTLLVARPYCARLIVSIFRCAFFLSAIWHIKCRSDCPFPHSISKNFSRNQSWRGPASTLSSLSHYTRYGLTWIDGVRANYFACITLAHTHTVLPRRISTSKITERAHTQRHQEVFCIRHMVFRIATESRNGWIISAHRTIQSFSFFFSLSLSISISFRFGNRPLLCTMWCDENPLKKHFLRIFSSDDSPSVSERLCKIFFRFICLLAPSDQQPAAKHQPSKSFKNAEWNFSFPHPDFVRYFTYFFRFALCFRLLFFLIPSAFFSSDALRRSRRSIASSAM